MTRQVFADPVVPRAGPIPDIVSLVLQIVEEAQKPVSRLISARSAMEWCRPGERLFLHGKRCIEIYLGRFDALMSKPQSDHGTVHARL